MNILKCIVAIVFIILSVILLLFLVIGVSMEVSNKIDERLYKFVPLTDSEIEKVYQRYLEELDKYPDEYECEKLTETDFKKQCTGFKRMRRDTAPKWFYKFWEKIN